MSKKNDEMIMFSDRQYAAVEEMAYSVLLIAHDGDNTTRLWIDREERDELLALIKLLKQAAKSLR